MTTPAITATLGPRAPRMTATLPAALPAPLARRVLGEATLLGIAADALLRDGPGGVGLPLWVTLLALAFIALAWCAGRLVSREVVGWLGTAIVFATMVAWRDSETLRVGGVLATMGTLAMAAIALRDPSAGIRAARLRDTVWAAVRAALIVALGLLPLALREAIAGDSAGTAGRRAAPLLRAALFAAPPLLLFGALLRSADPVFASLVSLPELDILTLLSHVVVIGVFAWLAAGWARGALDERPTTAAPDLPPFAIGALEITATLGALDVLFAAYVLTQLGWFFGGEQFLRARTGLTAAEYARQGFFQMIWVVLLVVPLLLSTRALLQPGRELARRHTLLALPLLALLGAMILSALARLQLYVHYYGLTTDRLYPLAFMIWLAVVLAWLAVTVLRGRGERFVAGALVSALATLAVLNIIAPDVIVARVNIARAASVSDRDRPLDLRYLARLSGEATPLALDAIIAPPRDAAGTLARLRWDDERCAAAELLLARWGDDSRLARAHRAPGSWRRWNAGEAAALRTVREGSAALRAAQHESCSAPRARRARNIDREVD